MFFINILNNFLFKEQKSLIIALEMEYLTNDNLNTVFLNYIEIYYALLSTACTLFWCSLLYL